jgi:PLP dependent protein
MPNVAIDATTIADRVARVRERIARAALRASRNPDAIKLVAVAKGMSPERIRAAAAAGIDGVGENRLQEAESKMPVLADLPLNWHFIGRLQRRKAKDVVGRFTLIHSVDSIELAEEIDRRAAAAGVVQAVLIQVNIGGEASKAGFPPEAVTSAIASCDNLRQIHVRGLMAIPPAVKNAGDARPYFRRLRELAASIDHLRLRELSMGMSGDFEVAVEEGATYVRIGTAIFGERSP